MNTVTVTDKTAREPTDELHRRSARFFVTRGLLLLVVLLVALPVLGFAYESIMAAVDARRFPPPGQLVAVNGRQMHLNCTGTGSPTVVMDAGLGGWSLDWSRVQPDITRVTRICSYDRAGMGWSDPSGEPLDARHAVQDLHSLLVNSGEEGPFVLVGHSNGGLRILLYANAYPQSVAGVVLVDPTPIATDEEQLTFLSPSERAEYMGIVQEMKPDTGTGGFNIVELVQALRPFGVARLLSHELLEGTAYDYLSDDAQPAYAFGLRQGSHLATLMAEAEQRLNSVEQVRAVKSLGNTPLAILTSTKMGNFYSDPQPTDLPPRLLELGLKTLWEAQADMAGLSSSGTIEPVERSGHYIQFDRPDAVIGAIRFMVNQVSR